MNVILCCPVCKRSEMYDYDEYVKSCHPLTKTHHRIHCDNELCPIKPVMVYHKDVKE